MSRLYALALAALLAIAPSFARAQSSPNFSYGQVPTAGQWNAAFASKQDVLNFTPLNLAGGTMRGKLNTAAATFNQAGFSILPGVAPTSATNGDLWLTSAGLYAQINGQPVQLLTSAGLGTMATQNANAVTITGGTINGTAIGGATPAAGAFTMLAATSLTGLTTPLSAAQGGTGFTSITAALDGAFSSTQGAILYRGPSAWLALAPGTSGQMLTTNGAGANPSWTTPAAASTAVPVRQTALYGPASAGMPSVLPSTTSGTLTLTAQNVSSSAPFVITAAQGSLGNATYTYTSNPSWTVPASTTAYLFVNASTGATSTQTLAPIYQFGGTPSTASGQFTFDYQAMVGYLGNGTAAVATPLVCIGQATTSASAVTSSIAYAYQGFFDSGWVAGLPTTTNTVSHNLGIQPLARRMIAENTTSENGYSVGDQVASDAGLMAAFSTYVSPLGVRTDRLTITSAQGNSGTGWAVMNLTTNAPAVMTAANWRRRYQAQRGW